MNLEILDKEKIIFKDKVKLVRLPGSKGSFTVIYNHAPIISTLKKGDILLTLNDGSQKMFPINEGIVEVKKNNITILIFS